MPLIMPRDEFELLRRLSIQLTDLVAVVAASESSEAATLCLVPPTFVKPGSDMVCDRKKGHPGKHTWELGDEIARLSVGVHKQTAAWIVPASQMVEMRRWLEMPSGTYYPLTPGKHDSASLAFEAAMHGDIRIRMSV